MPTGTIANNGDRVSGTLAPEPGDSPVAYTQVTDKDGHTIKGGDNDSIHEQVIYEGDGRRSEGHSRNRGQQRHRGPRQHRRPGQWGKTGTTENNGDAWFCGATEEVTACVWVGYADTTTPMTTLYNGGPVMGGTFPALIWASVISAWEGIKAERAAERASGEHACRERRRSPLPTEAAPAEEEYEATPEEEAAKRLPKNGARSRSGDSGSRPGRTHPAPESGGGGGVTAG